MKNSLVHTNDHKSRSHACLACMHIKFLSSLDYIYMYFNPFIIYTYVTDSGKTLHVHVQILALLWNFKFI